MAVTSHYAPVRSGRTAGPEADLRHYLGLLFTRAEPRGRALAYVEALLADPRRGNAAEIAQRAGADSAWSTQRLLTRAVWDADRLRDGVRARAVALLGGSASCVVLCRQQTERAGDRAVAVAPQPAGPFGRERNSQVAALLCYVSRLGGAVVDRELYLPPQWSADAPRCARGGVPPERVRPRSMAELGQDMVERAIAATVPIDWVFGGPDFAAPVLFQWLCRRRLPFCVELPPAAPRCLAEPARPAPGFRLALLTRPAPIGRPAVFLLHAPTAIPDAVAARAQAGMGLTAVRAIEQADCRAGLSSHQVRSWLAWYRHTTLAMTAAALLLEAELAAGGRRPDRPDRPG